MKGPASRTALDPQVLVAFLESRTTYTTGGYPNRRRRFINGQPAPMEDNDARIIRRWASGSIEGVSLKAAEKLLANYGLTMPDLLDFNPTPLLRGALPY